MRKRVNKVAGTIEQMEEWRSQFVEWAEALMAMLWGRPGQQSAARVNALNGWMEESPV
jgi:spore germination cell wall hydrolase CwlJ-like protein